MINACYPTTLLTHPSPPRNMHHHIHIPKIQAGKMQRYIRSEVSDIRPTTAYSFSEKR